MPPGLTRKLESSIQINGVLLAQLETEPFSTIKKLNISDRRIHILSADLKNLTDFFLTSGAITLIK